MSLALLHLHSNDNAPDERGPNYIGLHHMGFLVDDVPTSSEAVEAAGGIDRALDAITDGTLDPYAASETLLRDRSHREGG